MKMTKLTTNCKKCEKPIEFMIPISDIAECDHLDIKYDTVPYQVLRMIEGLQVHCSGCKTLNSLEVKSYKLGVK